MTAEVVICGAGIAGVSAAYHLAVKQGLKQILLVEQDTPLSLTSDKSTECYRNWWPGPGDAMVSLMNRSIDLLEELAWQSDNRFHFSHRGYLYVTSKSDQIPSMRAAAEQTSALGAGPLRLHTGAGAAAARDAAHAAAAYDAAYAAANAAAYDATDAAIDLHKLARLAVQDERAYQRSLKKGGKK